ncbi:hypothetical protein SETIT_9G168500v2 [Setaria italica]|uniref:Uncharacterized protein n=1 Tax=Setaria italica TaxID=4555 RepID=A0A368SHL7_SETIT|nr:hypothetical protein SETIT_9G168500v2 [Setaria italica]
MTQLYRTPFCCRPAAPQPRHRLSSWFRSFACLSCRSLFKTSGHFIHSPKAAMDRYRGGNLAAFLLTVVILVAATSAFYSAAAEGAAVAAPGCEASLGWDLDRSCAVSGALSSECCDVVLTLVERGGIPCLCRVTLTYPFVYSGYTGDDVLIWYSQGCGGPAKVPDSCLEAAAAGSAPEPAAFSTEPLF